MTTTPLEYISSLHDVDWPEHSVFIVDAGLPSTATKSLPDPKIEVDAGESLKDLARLGELAEEVLAIRSTRPLTLVAVGGGSLGDALGFLASILWRGVGLWQVPTTLVAMVDSAHGGKTAINLGGRKNQLGTFYDAERVVVCDEFLETLPLDLREEGLAELIKTLWLGAPDMLAMLDDATVAHTIAAGPISSARAQWRDLVTAAVETKYAVVAEDPHEKSGHRRILNLGHTAGHGLEAVYGLPHGRAVAWGLAACALLSVEFAGLSQEQARRLLSHIDPLLSALPRQPSAQEKQRFFDCLKQDKKRVDGELISVLLDGPGQPVQTRSVTADDWWRAVWQAADRWRGTTLQISAPQRLRTPDYALPPGKSEANRAEVIAHLRPETPAIDAPATVLPDDVAELRRALSAMAAAQRDEELIIHAGEGGTTGRFLLAAAALRKAPTTIVMGPQLRRRPHTPLLEALRGGGAQIREIEKGYRIVPWQAFPRVLRVDASSSSQFASALALLAASGHHFRLHLEGPMVSQPYFELTLRMLESAGIFIDRKDGQTLEFSRGSSFAAASRLQVPPDASSAVVWHGLAAVHDDLQAPPALDTGHPDCIFPELVDKLTQGGDQILTISLADAPDLAPVLAAVATRLPAGLLVTDAPHLRHKESDRIGELADAFDEIGLKLDPRPDGFEVPTGIQSPARHALFDPRGDHRLAMAALVLVTPGNSLSIVNARCVTKSYPDLWRQARRAGCEIRPTKST